MERTSQETVAAMAGMSVRSARNWQEGPLPSENKPERQWRTRSDPFEGVWEDEIEPLLREEAARGLRGRQLSNGWMKNILGASSLPTCGRCSGGCGSGELSMGRRRSIFRGTVAHPLWTWGGTISMSESARRHVGIKEGKQGWTDSQIITSLGC